jgi:SAM-dependent methyltransferase
VRDPTLIGSRVLEETASKQEGRMRAFDQAIFDRLQQKVLADVAGGMGVFMAFIGDQTGIYRTLADGVPRRSAELADETGVDRRYLREWLCSNAANGYVTYNPDDDSFSMSPEQSALFADDSTTRCVQGYVQALVSQIETWAEAVEVFRSGRGRPWSAHSPCCFCATDRGFRPVYEEYLVQSWLPAIDGIQNSLAAGAKIADIGCGHGSAVILLAKAFPNSVVYGFDLHPPSIEAARQQAAAVGLANAHFQVSAAKEFPGKDYDLICIFDALHDFGDPVGTAQKVRTALKKDGVFLVIEQFANNELKDNLTPLAALIYGFSTTICLPVSRSQEVGLCLGAQAGERRLARVLRDAGFGKVRCAIANASGLVLEARA